MTDVATASMEGYQVRVVQEKADLDDRLQKLTAFFATETFGGLPEAERGRMIRQSKLMTDLSAVLGARIAAFGI